tara:strand:- start:186 stop:1184 length:999 start_codon:yes stop_codon:yes gene_type:complete
MPRKAKKKEVKEKPPPKKRGRKPKPKTNVEKPPPKKRGRKPKGGKIIKKNQQLTNTVINKTPNVILHLKCNSEELNNINKFDMNYTPNISNPEAFNIAGNNKMFELQFTEVHNSIKNNNSIKNTIIKTKKTCAEIPKESNINSKDLWEKLNTLKKNLRCNNVSDKRAACFWCTYEFDNPAVYIPKQYNGDCLEVYGCFCSPECALSYLKNEQIDDSTKWERYALLNNVYSKIYDYNKSIKPAPDPHYTLDKYYGNLSIQEYRKLLSKERIFMIVDKPMTKILPELYEENNEIPNVYNNILDKDKKNTVSNFRLKRSQTKQSKTNAITNNFNL